MKSGDRMDCIPKQKRRPAAWNSQTRSPWSECDKWPGNRAPLVTKIIWTRSKNRTTVGVRTHTSAPSYHDGPAWPCTGALYPCICRQPPGETISACRRDDLGVANQKCDSDGSRLSAAFLRPARGRVPAERKNQRVSRVRPARSLD